MPKDWAGVFVTGLTPDYDLDCRRGLSRLKFNRVFAPTGDGNELPVQLESTARVLANPARDRRQNQSSDKGAPLADQWDPTKDESCGIPDQGARQTPAHSDWFPLRIRD